MIHTEDQLIDLAKNSPKELARILNNSNTDIKTLIPGIEILCEYSLDEILILPIIKQLLKHPNAFVRESSVIGIVAFYSSSNPPKDILDTLRFISKNDPSNNLKLYANETLKTFSKD